MTAATKTTTTTTPPTARRGVAAAKRTDLEVAANPCDHWSTRELDAYVGGLSRPSKMPGWAYSIPARECRTGTKLREVAGSTCEHCYAMKGRYRFPNVEAAMYRRLQTITAPHWVDAMVALIGRKGSQWFRWHDSGDLQSVDHFARICEVARRTPDVNHWIPTREYRTVHDYIDGGGQIPANLSVRMSAHIIGGKVPTFPRLPMVTVSTVSPVDSPPPDAHRCPAPHQGNQCGDCRACWDPSVRLIDYALH